MNESELDKLEKERECVAVNFCNIKAVDSLQHNATYQVIVEAYRDLFNVPVEDDDLMKRPGSAKM